MNDFYTLVKKDNGKNTKTLVNEKYSMYSDSDYLVPFDLLKQYCKDIDSVLF